MMVLPELLLSTSLLSLACLLWGFIQAVWGKEECAIGTVVAVEGVGRDVNREEDEEEEEEAEEEEGAPSSSTGSEAGYRLQEEADRATPRSSSPGSPRLVLSRRQRKNRKREKEDSRVKPKAPERPGRDSPVLSRGNSDEKMDASTARAKKRSVPCRQYTKLGAGDSDIYYYFSSYLLSSDQMRQLGFPQDSSLYPGKAYIYRDPEFTCLLPEGHTSDLDDGEYLAAGPRLDPSARPFLPRRRESPPAEEEEGEDWCLLPSGRGSQTGSESGQSRAGGASSCCSSQGDTEGPGISLNATAKEFIPSTGPGASLPSTVSAPDLHRASRLSPTPASSLGEERDSSEGEGREGGRRGGRGREGEGRASERTLCLASRSSPDLNSTREEARCCRCHRVFRPRSPQREQCTYHWGKPAAGGKAEARYSCCGARVAGKARGCCSSARHVWSGLPAHSGILGPLEGYVKTKHRKSYPTAGNFGVYGVDCEMCYTVAGLELTKVTVVGIDGRLVYEALVLPDSEVLDYNTRFSGIAQKDLERGPTKNLKEVQNDLMGFINADTVLVGHGLENDLRALQLIHGVVLDTSAVFPHYCGLPYRRSLRSLVSSYLKRDIQSSSWGHDSYEDARACIDLMLWKARKDGCGRKTVPQRPEP